MKRIYIITYEVKDFGNPKNSKIEIVETFFDKEHARKRIREYGKRYHFYDIDWVDHAEGYYYTCHLGVARFLSIETVLVEDGEKFVYILVIKGEIDSVFENEQDALKELKDKEDAKIVCKQLK